VNAVCTHTRTSTTRRSFTYTGGYDDMVLAKTQIRTRVESDNEQREKKIAQLRTSSRASRPARARAR